MRLLRASRSAAAAVACASFTLVCVQGAAEAGDAKAGRKTVEEVCAVCHGADGLSKVPEAPNLAGQNEGYIIAQLGAFKSGARVNEQMSVVIKDLKDADIENVAAYYAAIPISVGKPPE